MTSSGYQRKMIPFCPSGKGRKTSQFLGERRFQKSLPSQFVCCFRPRISHVSPFCVYCACAKLSNERQSCPQRPRSFWSAPRMRTSGIIHIKFRLKTSCDWLLYFTGSVIETGSFRIAIKQVARVKSMKMSL